MSEQVVGHKTLRNDDGSFRHEPLYESEARLFLSMAEAADAKRKELMPDEETAIRMLFDAYTRLKEFGWNDPCYCPKDGSSFQVLELGSTGKHNCVYEGTWPDGCWWIVEDGDMCPTHPAMFKAHNAGGNQPPR